MKDIHNKLKNLKDFIKSKTDLGTTNYIMKEINEVCGMVETEQLRQYNVSGQSEQLVCPCCGSDKTYKTDAIHCNMCAMTTEI